MQTVKALFRQRAVWFVTVFIAGLLAGYVALPRSVGNAGESKSVWQERSKPGDPVLPGGYAPLPSLAGLVKQVKPAVVNIYTTQVIKARSRMRGPNQFDPFPWFGGMDDPFERFFFGGPSGEMKTRALGSGFVVSPDGYLISNNHVVANASEIKVKLVDGRSFDAKVIGADERTDIALLKINAKGNLPFVYLGDSDKLEVGDWVVAIGNPFGLGHSVSAGIVSGKDREIGHGVYDDFIQTDASINPGNSGGPLFDTAGSVVGINTAIIQGGNSVGFAVPVNMAKEMLPQLQQKGKVSRGWLGIGIQDLSQELAENFNVPEQKGVLIAQVFAGSPAEKAGLKTGDIVVSLDSKGVEDARTLTRRIGAYAPNSKITLQVLRENKPLTFNVTLREREAGEAMALGEAPSSEEGQSNLGLQLSPVTPERARRLGLDEATRGLLVNQVDESGPTAGILRPGDVILEVNRKSVGSPKDFDKALSLSKRDKVLLLVQRGQAQLFVSIQK
jgi:serine protease Do